MILGRIKMFAHSGRYKYIHLKKMPDYSENPSDDKMAQTKCAHFANHNSRGVVFSEYEMCECICGMFAKTHSHCTHYYYFNAVSDCRKMLNTRLLLTHSSESSTIMQSFPTKFIQFHVAAVIQLVMCAGEIIHFCVSDRIKWKLDAIKKKWICTFAKTEAAAAIQLKFTIQQWLMSRPLALFLSLSLSVSASAPLSRFPSPSLFFLMTSISTCVCSM